MFCVFASGGCGGSSHHKVTDENSNDTGGNGGGGNGNGNGEQQQQERTKEAVFRLESADTIHYYMHNDVYPKTKKSFFMRLDRVK